MRRYAVIGNPITHSLSPQIHHRFAQLTERPVQYAAIEAPRHGFAQTIAALIDEGYAGFNVTLPFKEQAFELADDCTTRAQAAGAVNTLLVGAGGLRGDNTDGVGLLLDLEQHLGLRLAGQRVLILGAGGAARGIAHALKARAPHLVIANRTVSRAEELAAATGAAFCALDDWPRLGPFDLIIHTTSAGHADGVAYPATSLTRTVCYDISYGPAAESFLDWARRNDAQQTADGLGMLVGQAAESFYLWEGIRPPVAPVVQELTARRSARRDL